MRRPAGTVTFLFTDIEGSTAWWEQHPDAMRLALARHDEVVRAVVADFGGYVFSTGGDGFAVAFDEPTPAARAALQVQSRLASEPLPGPVVLRARIGLHTGTADERDGDYFGPTLNRAARVMSVAAGGQVVVSAATAELIRGLEREGAVLVELGRRSLRGIGMERVFGLCAEGDSLGIGGVVGPVVRLPSLTSSFVGRELELVELAAALGSARLVTLVGPGGVGKTRLAIETGWAALEGFADGAWLAELAPVRDPEGLAHALVAALELRPLPGHSPIEALIIGLQGEHRLVVVDNCEHLLVDAASLLRRVVEQCPTVTVLATSRAPLGVPGERVWPLAPLPAASGVALFCDRAVAADARFVTGESGAAIEALCQRLDGMPLAIELAAARVRGMSPADLLARLDDRFRLLRAPRGTDARHGTLQATVEWSYQLLDEAAQVVFDRMGVFAGAVDLDAVVLVAGDATLDEFDVIDAVTTLVDHSLVVAERGEDRTHYRLLETMRTFARERLAGRGEDTSISRTHGEWAAVRVAALMAMIGMPDRDAAMGALEELDVFWVDLRTAVRSAVADGNSDLAVRLVSHFGAEAIYRERDEVGEWAEVVMTVPGWRAHELARNVVGVSALLHWRAGRYEAMDRYIELGTALADAPDLDGGVLDMIGLIARNTRGDFKGAQRKALWVIDRLRETGRTNGELWFFEIGVALINSYFGDSERAISALKAQDQWTNPLADCYWRWAMTQSLIDADPAAAIPIGRATIAFAREVRATWAVDTVSNYLGAALAQAGDPLEVIETMRSVLDRAAAGGGVQSLGNTVRNGIMLFSRLGYHEAAVILAGWLDGQAIVIPGTAGMRTRAAKAIEQITTLMPENVLAAWRARGAAMSAIHLVHFLQAQLDQAEAELTHDRN